MSDHYIEHMQAELRRVRQENHLLHAKVASLQAKAPTDAQVHLLLSRITELTAEKEAAEAEVERLTADFNAAVERIHELLAEKVDREAAIQRVRELHAPVEGWGRGVRWCSAACESTSDGDPTEWPCDTLHALDGGDDA